MKSEAGFVKRERGETTRYVSRLRDAVVASATQARDARYGLMAMKSSFIIHNSSLAVWSGVIVVWGMAFCISCRLTAVPIDIRGTGTQRSVALAILGESRVALSGHFYEIADVYFHKGVEHVHVQAFENGIFQKISKEISPEPHIHVGGQDIKEMMPWLWLTIRMDPKNIETYLVAAFWLAHDLKRFDLAHQVLREAQCNNTFNYEVQLEKGRIYLKEEKLEEAKQAFNAGLAFLPGGENLLTREEQAIKASLLLYRALLYEVEGGKEYAIRDLNEILKMFPERAHLQHRIEALEKGSGLSLLASQYLNAILKKDEQARTTCHRCDHHHEDHHEHGHHH